MVTKHLSEMHSKNLESAVKLARLSVENSQRVLALQAQLAKAVFDATVSNAKAHAGVRSPQDLLALNTQYLQETAKRIMDVARQVGEISNESRSEFSRVLTEQLASGKQDLADAVQNVMKGMPAGVPDLKKSVDQAMSMANAAFEQISKVSASALGSLGGKAAAAPAAKKAATKKAAATPAAKKPVTKKPAAKKAAVKPTVKAVAKPAVKKVAAKR